MASLTRFPIKRVKKASERIYVSKKELMKKKLSYFDLLYIRHMCAYKFAVPYIKNEIVLDLGCGSGYGTYYLSTKDLKQIIGIDISKEAIEYSKREYFNDNLQYEIMDSSKLAFKKNSFDVVICFQVIEHIDNLDHFLSDIHRTTKMFIVSTPNKKTFNDAGRNPFHVREFYLNDLQVLLQSVFQKVNMFGVYPVIQTQNICNKVEKLQAQIDNLHLRPLLDLIPIRIKKLLSFIFFKIDEDISFKIHGNPSENCLDFIAVCIK